MILKGSQRGGARNLALHLTNTQDNDCVEVRSVEGFMSANVHDAFREMHAVSKLSKAKQFIFSLSLSPPKDAPVSGADFDKAIDQAATRLGLAGQPRIVILHTKNSRTHAHVAFSRIKVEEGRAVNLPFYKERLNELSQDLFLDHGWQLPNGIKDRAFSDPQNYSLEEYQVALRSKRDPKEVKQVLQSCWQQSDSQTSLMAALRDNGFELCKGDRRGFVAIHWSAPDTVYSLSRWMSVKSMALRSRLNDPETIPSLEEGRLLFDQEYGAKHRKRLQTLQEDHEKKLDQLKAHKSRLKAKHARERSDLLKKQQDRKAEETLARARFFRKGLAGFWDWVTGKRRMVEKQLSNEAAQSRLRAEAETGLLRDTHRRELTETYRKLARQKKHHLQSIQRLSNYTNSQLQAVDQTTGASHSSFARDNSGFRGASSFAEHDVEQNQLG